MVNAIKRSIDSRGLSWPVLVFCFVTSDAFALEGQTTLKPAKVKEIQKISQSYSGCTSAATTLVAAKKMTVQELPLAFERCRDKYPSAGLFLDCKKNALAKSKGRALDPAALAQCTALLTAATFDGLDSDPVFTTRSDAYFAGLGMNQELKLTEMDLPNFTCEKLISAFQDVPKNAQHILFGNHPLMFLQGAEQAKYIKSLTALSSKKAKDAKFSDIPGFGRLFGDSHGKQSIVYFPSASCDFRGNLGATYSGVSLYYLPDTKRQTATPYFGVAYYRRNQKALTTPKLVAELLLRLGSRFKAYSKNEQTVFISAAPFSEVDQERDPRNICMQPRPQQFVAVIYSAKDDVNVPEYLLLANIKNLCEYGDRQAGFLAR
jgi:hypothetical protein